MGNFKSTLMGAASGATLGPVGAGLGALTGLLGSDNTTMPVLRDLTPGERKILRYIEAAQPGILKALNPDQILNLAKQFSANISEAGLRELDRMFTTERSNLRMDQIRTGGVLGSVGNELNARLTGVYGGKKADIIANANLTGTQMAEGVRSGLLNTATTFSNVASAIYGNQARTAGQTQPGSLVRDLGAAGLQGAAAGGNFQWIKDFFGGV